MNKIKLKKICKLTAFLTIVSSIILIGMFVLFSLVVLFSNFSPTLINKLTTIVSGVGIFASTYVISRIVKQKGVFLGLICGGVSSCIVFIATAISTGVLFSIAEFVKIIVILASAWLGGILGANSRQS